MSFLSPKRRHIAPLVVGLLYLALAVGFDAVTPSFEAPDENHHFYTVQFIAAYGRLPAATEDVKPRQEAAQPPLYYVLAAPILAALDSPSFVYPQFNPHVAAGKLGTEVNANAFVHTEADSWPWRGAARSVHLLRLFSIVLGLVSLLSIYASARLLWPEQPMVAFAASGLMAALPQWNALHATVTNDTLSIAMCSVSLCYLIWLRGRRPRLSELIVLGVLVGLSILAKLVGLVMLVYGLLWLSISEPPWRDGRRWLRSVAIVMSLALLVSSWLFWRNFRLYGDPTATSQFVALAGGERKLPFWFLLTQLDSLWPTSIAAFGWVTVAAPEWVYSVWAAILALGAGGVMWSVRRGCQTRTAGECGRLGLLALWPVAVAVAWFLFNVRTPAEQGRLLFPGLLPIALALGYGLTRLPRPVPLLALVAAVATSVFCVGVVVPRAFALPELLPPDALPVDAVRLDRDMGLGVRLVGSRVDTMSARPGDWAEVTLFWRRTAAVDEPALVSAEIAGRAYHSLTTRPDAYHDRGLYPSTVWPTDRLVAETIRLHIDPTAGVPTVGRVLVRLTGQEPLVDAGMLKLLPPRWPPMQTSVLATIEPGIEITTATVDQATIYAGDPITVRLRWQVRTPPGRDLVTFVHLAFPDLPPVAQADGPALGGDYPARLWTAGEVIDDLYVLEPPATTAPGIYDVYVGLYDPLTGARSPLYRDDGRAANDALRVTRVTVVAP